MRSDLELEAAERVENGIPPEEARYAAQRALGNATLLKEDVREMWGWPSLERALQDLRYAARILRKAPGFTVVAVLSLALGIGANTSVFSVLDAVLLKSLPVSHPEQLRILTWIRHGDPIGMKSHSGWAIYDDRGRPVDGSFSYPAYEIFRKTVPQFSDVVAFAPNQFTVTDNATSDLVFGHYVSGNYFTGLGAQPLLGRPILPEDDAPGKPGVAVLTYLYWNKRFAGDPAVVGRLITVNRVPVTVIGVMPAAFQGLMPGRAIDLFVPFSMVPETAPAYYALAAPDFWWVQIFGRLKPGASEAAATAAVQATLAHQIDSYAGTTLPSSNRPKIVLEPGSRGAGPLRGSIQTSIYILAAVAGLVLLIACINLVNLLLARYASRSREIAIRISIGAGRWRLMRQMLAESMLLAGMGAIAGLFLAKPMLRLLLNFFSGTSILGLDARLDGRALGFTFLVAMITALLFGTMPAWRAAHVNAGSSTKETGAIAAGHRHLLGRYLVSLQIGLSLVLLVGTGLFLRTLLSLTAVNLGFQTDNILTFQTDPGRSGYKPPQAGALYRRLEGRITAIPGVEAVAISQLPLIGGVVTNGPIHLPGSGDNQKQTWFIYCSDSFLSTMRIPVVLGRDLSRADFDREIPSAVVNETLVKKYLRGVNPIGRIFYLPHWVRDNGSEVKPFTIVGVAKDAHYRGVRDPVPPTAYMPFPWRPPGDSMMVFAIRTRLAPLSLAPAVRRAVGNVDANLPVAEVRTEREQIDRSLGTERLFATLVSIFGANALILAAIGIYGVMAFSVNRRTREIGVRMALGAQRGEVRWLVLRQSLHMAMLGIVVGVPSALLLTGLVRKLLYGVKPNDPASLVAAVIVIAAVAAFAAWIPARRASRVDPIVALRYE